MTEATNHRSAAPTTSTKRNGLLGTAALIPTATRRAQRPKGETTNASKGRGEGRVGPPPGPPSFSSRGKRTPAPRHPPPLAARHTGGSPLRPRSSLALL